MRATFTKLMTVSMVAGAALLVSACGGSETANTATTNTTEMSNDMGDSMEGSMNDVTAMDATAGADANMAMDSMNEAAPMENSSNGM